MKSIFMRVLFCKIHCPPFICFCKPYSSHLYSPGPLKLENTPHDSLDHLSGGTTEVKEENSNGKQQDENVPKSCIKKKVHKKPGDPKEIEKKSVQWMDKLGKELVEIKEFESRKLCRKSERKEDKRMKKNIRLMLTRRGKVYLSLRELNDGFRFRPLSRSQKCCEPSSS